MPTLFSPLTLKSITLRNRIGVSPMCQYSYHDGFANDWHLVHLGSRAVGGAGLVIAEASAVEARGRISPADLGIWKDEHIEPLARTAHFIHSQGAIAGIQIAHAGRKASTAEPWKPGNKSLPPSNGGWQPIGPSPIPFDTGYPTPTEMTTDDIEQLKQSFAAAARRALAADFRWLEIHSAHGYLAHSFLSPLSNHRTDHYGGSFENRTRFLLETTAAVRAAWPDHLPLAVRLSCTDWADGGWDIEQSIELSKLLKQSGVDLIDCSSGALIPHVKIPTTPGYQVPFAAAIRAQAHISTAAVGLITDPTQADTIISNGQADLILLARKLLTDPYWPIHAAQELNRLDQITIPPQYARGM